MRTRALIPLLLLGACVSRWPAGSYNGLAKDADNEAVLGALSECTAYLVPNHAVVNVTTTADALSMLLPEALSRQGLVPGSSGLPVTYVIASTGVDSRAREAEGAFIRVSTAHGTCAQYFSRDSNGVLQSAGPVMVVLQ